MRLMKYAVVFFLLCGLLMSVQPAEGRILDKDSIDVSISIPYHLSLEINFLIDELERLAIVDAEGLIFTEEMILEAMAETPFLEEEEIFGFVVEHEDPIEVVTFGNMPHELLLSSDEYEVFWGPDNEAIPIDRLEWRVARDDRMPDEGWEPLSTDDILVIEREEPGRYAEEIEFRLWLTIEDAVGAYEGDLVFTVGGI